MMSTALAERRADPIVVIRQNLTQMEPQFRAALPKHVSVEKFTRVAMTAIQNNPDLLTVDRQSLFGAIVRLAQDGLLPDGREAAIVKFGNKAQAMPMIAGILKKVRQSGDVAKVSAQVVYADDEFVWKLGFDEDVTHNPPPLDQPRGKAIGAYATAVLKDGSRLLEVMNFDEIEQVRKVSRASGNGPWVQWWGEMARKTVMRRLSKRLPMSTDLDDDFERDETLPPEPVVEHDAAPRSRLELLEDHIEAANEPEISPQPAPPAEAEPLNNAGEAAAPAEGAKPTPAEAAVLDRMAAVSRGEGPGHQEGRDDADMGEHDPMRQCADRLIADKRDGRVRSARDQADYEALSDEMRAEVDAAGVE